MRTRLLSAKPMKRGPRIVEDAARGELKDIYAPVDEFGQERKPSLQNLSGDSVGQDKSRASSILFPK